jgi:hypothetical protein
LRTAITPWLLPLLAWLLLSEPALAQAPQAAARGGLRSPFAVAFDEPWLQVLPWCSDVTSILETLEPTAVSDRFSGAGDGAGEPARLGIHAASWTELQYRLAGFDATDPERGGTPLVLLPRLATDAFQLQSAALGLEEAAGPGALISLEPPRPGRKWSGRFSALLAPTGLQTDVEPTSAPAISRLRDGHEVGGLLSGPLRGERLGATFAFEWERADRSERGDPLELRGERKSALLQLSWTPRPTDEARLLVAGHALERPFAGRLRFADPSVGETERALFTGAAWSRRTGAGARIRAAASFAAREFEPPAEAGRSVGLERLDAGPIPGAVAEPARLRTFRGEAAYVARPRTTGSLRHEPLAAFEAEWSRLSTSPAPALLVGEAVDGRPARAWSFSEAGAASRSLQRLALGVQDRISLPDRLDVRLGLRFDAQDGSRPDASSLVSWRDLSPRLAFEVRPRRGSSLAFHGGAALYTGRLPLQLLELSDPLARTATVHRWTDPDRDGLLQPRERGVLIARSGPGGEFVTIDPDLAPPRTTEFTAALMFERGIARLTFAGEYRRTSGLPETVNTGVPASSYRVLQIPDPSVDIDGASDDRLLSVYDRNPSTFGQDRYLLTNPAGDDVVQQGAELALELRPWQRLRVRLGGTASMTTGPGANRGFRVSENDPGLTGELYDDPNSDSFATGRMFFDRGFTLKLAAAYQTKRLGAGFVARYSDGQPFARVVVVEGLAQGPDFVQAVRRGDHRFTYILTVDARAAWSLDLGGWRATASVEAFSLFRQRVEVEEYPVWGPNFRDVTASQPPRALRLGLRVDF